MKKLIKKLAESTGLNEHQIQCGTCRYEFETKIHKNKNVTLYRHTCFLSCIILTWHSEVCEDYVPKSNMKNDTEAKE